MDILCIDVTIQVTSEMCLLALQFNPLAYTNACQAFWAIDVFSFNSSLLSVDGMTSYTVSKLKKRPIQWYIIRRDCIHF